MKLHILVLLFLGAVLTQAVCETSRSWWDHSVIYQIYPRSFKDSDGDGIGDIKGIISKLEFLKETGITAAWLSPIYKSPQVDGGYDVSDYRDIQEEYGTLEDFDLLVQKAKELGLHVILDIVPNHSSNEHEWFIKSENGEPEYEDYYVWADGPNNDDKTPPNNWLSVFKYSAWEYSKIRKQWYLHQFAIAQPDFNYKNPKILQEMKDILGFWMDRGVHGFRMDAVPFLHETGMLDEPPSGIPNVPDYEHGYLKHIYTSDQPETYGAIYDLRDYVDEYNKNQSDGIERIMVTEAYANITNTMLYYGNETRLGAHFTFNFEIIQTSYRNTAIELVDLIKRWLDYLPKDFVSNWVMGNHDQSRLATKMGVENVIGFNTLLSVLPGVQITYQGEEIGMENGYVTYAEGKDPSACNAPPEDFNKTSRDFERTPYHWDSTKNAGFSSGDHTWLPVSEKYVNNNLKKQQSTECSVYKIYQQVLCLRKNLNVLKDGDLEITAVGDNIIALKRCNDKDDDLLFVFNKGNDNEVLNLQKLFKTSENLKIEVSSTGNTGVIDARKITLKPHEVYVLLDT